MTGNSNKLIIISILIAGILIASAILYVNKTKVGTPQAGLLLPEQAAEIAMNYINENILGGETTASLIDVVEENGIYKIHFKIEEEEYNLYLTKDAKLLFPQVIDLENILGVQPEAQGEEVYTIGDFLVSEDEVCKENEKPIIYFFGSENCSHCRWEDPIMEKVGKNFEGYISFHNNMDSDVDMDIFSKYSTGGIPTLVFGCKYYRVGSGEGAGEEAEFEALTALICKLTEGQPTGICDPVQDLIEQIK